VLVILILLFIPRVIRIRFHILSQDVAILVSEIESLQSGFWLPVPCQTTAQIFGSSWWRGGYAKPTSRAGAWHGGGAQNGSEAASMGHSGSGHSGRGHR
jgi:hypothetical protein